MILFRVCLFFYIVIQIYTRHVRKNVFTRRIRTIARQRDGELQRLYKEEQSLFSGHDVVNGLKGGPSDLGIKFLQKY